MLDRQEPARAAEAGLHLVDDHDDPCSSQIRRGRRAMNSCGATMKPPSPWTGSITITATVSAATWVISARSSAASASSALGPR